MLLLIHFRSIFTSAMHLILARLIKLTQAFVLNEAWRRKTV